MQIHNVTPKTKRIRARRIGRGGKRGTYSGRGIKGQKARAGAKIRPAERDILKKIPKLRGYRFVSFRESPVAVSFRKIEERFPAGATVTPEALFEKKLIRRVKGRMPRVKIVGGGKGGKAFAFKGVLFSRSSAARALPKKEDV